MYYLAGYADGEGCFRWNGSTVAACVTNTYRGILREYQDLWGGSIREKQKMETHHKQAYEWEVTGSNAALYATEIGPFLREKRKQAALVERLMSYPLGSDTRNECIHQLKQLKRREHE